MDNKHTDGSILVLANQADLPLILPDAEDTRKDDSQAIYCDIIKEKEKKKVRKLKQNKRNKEK